MDKSPSQFDQNFDQSTTTSKQGKCFKHKQSNHHFYPISFSTRDILTVKSLLTFLLTLLPILVRPGQSASTSNPLRDRLHRDCNKYQREKLSRDCYGVDETIDHRRVQDDCLADGTCTMITVVQVLTNKETEGLNITLYGFELGSTALKNFSFSLAGSDEEGDSTNQLVCSIDQTTNLVQATGSFANGLSLTSGSAAYSQQNGVACNWLLRYGEAWPVTSNGNPLNLILSKVNLKLVSGEAYVTYRSTALPTYRMQFLRKNCDTSEKVCLTGDLCHSLCEPLLIVTKNRNTQGMLDFRLYVAYKPEAEIYQVKVIIATTSPSKGIPSYSYDVTCGQFVFKDSFKYPNSTRVDLSPSLIYERLFVKNNELDMFRCLWSIPMVFEVSGIKYDLRAAPYHLKLKSQSETIGTTVRFPGFEKSRDLYRRCNRPVSERLSLECFGLDKHDPSSDCIRDSSCTMIVTLSTSLGDSESDRNTPNYSEDYLLLSIHAIGFNEDKDLELSVTFNVDNDNTENIAYNCRYHGRSHVTSLEVVHANRRQVRDGSKSHDKSSLECNWVLEKSRKTWPILKNGTELNLVLAESVSLILSTDSVAKKFEPPQVKLPIFRLRYLYRDCNLEHGDKLCLGEVVNCVERQNCKKLIIITKTYKDEDDLLVSIYGMDSTDVVMVTLNVADQPGRDAGSDVDQGETLPSHLKVTCDANQPKVNLRITNGSTFYWDNSLVTRSDHGSGIKCFWSIPKNFASQPIDLSLETVNLLIDFFDKSGSMANLTLHFDKLRLPGYQAPEVTDSAFQANLDMFLANLLIFIILFDLINNLFD